MKVKALFLLLLLTIPLSLFLYSKFSEKPAPPKETLSAKIEQVTPTPTIKKPTPTPTLIPLLKSSYTIAVYGDSMVDTMGEELDYLENALKKKYPLTKFNLYNYGIGGQNVEMGLSRWNSSFSNRERNYPPITQINADIIILGSFSYNTFDPHNIGRHRIGLTNLISEAKNTSSFIYLLVEIAPLAEGFGQGKNGPNMTPSAAIDQSNRIIEQLDDSLILGRELGLPVIDAYTPSQINGKYGERSNVNPDDGIHPSVEGHKLTAGIIVSTIKFK